MWSLLPVRSGYVPMHHNPVKEKNHETRLLLESMHPTGSQHRGETTSTSHARCTSQGTGECEVETKCVILYLMCKTCQACLQPHKNTRKPILSQLVCIFMVFPRGRKQFAHKLHSYSPHVNFIFQHSSDGFNFTLISLEGKSVTKKYISSALPSACE